MSKHALRLGIREVHAVVALLHGAAVRDDGARWDVERDETFDARARWRDEGDDAA